MPGQRGVGRVVKVSGLDATDPRVVGSVGVFKVVDLGMPGQTTGALDEAVGDVAQRPHLVRCQNIRDNDGADFVVFLDLGSGEHGFLRSSAESYTGARRGSSSWPFRR